MEKLEGKDAKLEKKRKVKKRKVLEIKDTSTQVMPWQREAKIKEGWVKCVGWAHRVVPNDTLLLRDDAKTKLIHTDMGKTTESEWF